MTEFNNKMSELLPTDEEMKRRSDKMEAFFEKYSNCNDGEEDGMDWSDEEIFGTDTISDESDGEDMAEEVEIDSGEAIEKISTEKFRELPVEKKYERLCNQFTPELVDSMKEAFKIREKQIGQLNLPFWNIQTEDLIKTHNKLDLQPYVSSCDEIEGSSLNGASTSQKHSKKANETIEQKATAAKATTKKKLTEKEDYSEITITESNASKLPDNADKIISLFAYKPDLKKGFRANTKICLWRFISPTIMLQYVRDKGEKGSKIIFISTQDRSCMIGLRDDEFLELKAKCVPDVLKNETLGSRVEILEIETIEKKCIDLCKLKKKSEARQGKKNGN